MIRKLLDQSCFLVVSQNAKNRNVEPAYFPSNPPPTNVESVCNVQCRLVGLLHRMTRHFRKVLVRTMVMIMMMMIWHGIVWWWCHRRIGRIRQRRRRRRRKLDTFRWNFVRHPAPLGRGHQQFRSLRRGGSRGVATTSRAIITQTRRRIRLFRIRRSSCTQRQHGINRRLFFRRQNNLFDIALGDCGRRGDGWFGRRSCRSRSDGSSHGRSGRRDTAIAVRVTVVSPAFSRDFGIAS